MDKSPPISDRKHIYSKQITKKGEVLEHTTQSKEVPIRTISGQNVDGEFSKTSERSDLPRDGSRFQRYSLIKNMNELEREVDRALKNEPISSRNNVSQAPSEDNQIISKKRFTSRRSKKQANPPPQAILKLQNITFQEQNSKGIKSDRAKSRQENDYQPKIIYDPKMQTGKIKKSQLKGPSGNMGAGLESYSHRSANVQDRTYEWKSIDPTQEHEMDSTGSIRTKSKGHGVLILKKPPPNQRSITPSQNSNKTSTPERAPRTSQRSENSRGLIGNDSNMKKFSNQANIKFRINMDLVKESQLVKPNQNTDEVNSYEKQEDPVLSPSTANNRSPFAQMVDAQGSVNVPPFVSPIDLSMLQNNGVQQAGDNSYFTSQIQTNQMIGVKSPDASALNNLGIAADDYRGLLLSKSLLATQRTETWREVQQNQDQEMAQKVSAKDKIEKLQQLKEAIVLKGKFTNNQRVESSIEGTNRKDSKSKRGSTRRERSPELDITEWRVKGIGYMQSKLNDDIKACFQGQNVGVNQKRQNTRRKVVDKRSYKNRKYGQKEQQPAYAQGATQIDESQQYSPVGDRDDKMCQNDTQLSSMMGIHQGSGRSSNLLNAPSETHYQQLKVTPQQTREQDLNARQNHILLGGQDVLTTSRSKNVGTSDDTHTQVDMTLNSDRKGAVYNDDLIVVRQGTSAGSMRLTEPKFTALNPENSLDQTTGAHFKFGELGLHLIAAQAIRGQMIANDCQKQSLTSQQNPQWKQTLQIFPLFDEERNLEWLSTTPSPNSRTFNRSTHLQEFSSLSQHHVNQSRGQSRGGDTTHQVNPEKVVEIDVNNMDQHIDSITRNQTQREIAKQENISRFYQNAFQEQAVVNRERQNYKTLQIQQIKAIEHRVDQVGAMLMQEMASSMIKQIKQKKAHDLSRLVQPLSDFDHVDDLSEDDAVKFYVNEIIRDNLRAYQEETNAAKGKSTRERQQKQHTEHQKLMVSIPTNTSPERKFGLGVEEDSAVFSQIFRQQNRKRSVGSQDNYDTQRTYMLGSNKQEPQTSVLDSTHMITHQNPSPVNHRKLSIGGRGPNTQVTLDGNSRGQQSTATYGSPLRKPAYQGVKIVLVQSPKVELPFDKTVTPLAIVDMSQRGGNVEAPPLAQPQGVSRARCQSQQHKRINVSQMVKLRKNLKKQNNGGDYNTQQSVGNARNSNPLDAAREFLRTAGIVSQARRVSQLKFNEIRNQSKDQNTNSDLKSIIDDNVSMNSKFDQQSSYIPSIPFMVQNPKKSTIEAHSYASNFDPVTKQFSINDPTRPQTQLKPRPVRLQPNAGVEKSRKQQREEMVKIQEDYMQTHHLKNIESARMKYGQLYNRFENKSTHRDSHRIRAKFIPNTTNNTAVMTSPKNSIVNGLRTRTINKLISENEVTTPKDGNKSRSKQAAISTLQTMKINRNENPFKEKQNILRKLGPVVVNKLQTVRDKSEMQKKMQSQRVKKYNTDVYEDMFTLQDDKIGVNPTNDVTDQAVTMTGFVQQNIFGKPFDFIQYKDHQKYHMLQGIKADFLEKIKRQKSVYQDRQKRRDLTAITQEELMKQRLGIGLFMKVQEQKVATGQSDSLESSSPSHSTCSLGRMAKQFQNKKKVPMKTMTQALRDIRALQGGGIHGYVHSDENHLTDQTGRFPQPSAQQLRLDVLKAKNDTGISSRNNDQLIKVVQPRSSSVQKRYDEHMSIYEDRATEERHNITESDHQEPLLENQPSTNQDGVLNTNTTRTKRQSAQYSSEKQDKYDVSDYIEHVNRIKKDNLRQKSQTSQSSNLSQSMSPAQRSKAIARHRKPDSSYQDVGRIRALNHLGEELTITEEQSLDNQNSKGQIDLGQGFPTTDYQTFHGGTTSPGVQYMQQKQPLVKKIVNHARPCLRSPKNQSIVSEQEETTSMERSSIKYNMRPKIDIDPESNESPFQELKDSNIENIQRIINDSERNNPVPPFKNFEQLLRHQSPVGSTHRARNEQSPREKYSSRMSKPQKLDPINESEIMISQQSTHRKQTQKQKDQNNALWLQAIQNDSKLDNILKMNHALQNEVDSRSYSVEADNTFVGDQEQ